MSTLKPEKVFKKLATLVRTRERLHNWVKTQNTDAWKAARKQVYKRAQEASRIVRQKDWSKSFTSQERVEIKRLFRHVREDVLNLFNKLDLISMRKRARAGKLNPRSGSRKS